MILKGYIFSILYALLCLLLALVAYKLGLPKKYSRKIVHILVGFEWVILYHYVGATFHFLLVCIFFLILLSISHFKNLMPMIASEGDNAPGTVYYALAMTIMASICLFIPSMMLPFGIAVFCTSVGDGVAAVCGQLIKKFNPKIYKNKSLFGTLINFVLSTAVVLLFNFYFSMGLEFWQCFIIGLLSAELETVTGFGLDNITITLGVSFLTFGFLNVDFLSEFIVPIILTLPIIAVISAKKILTPIGIIIAIVLDLTVSFVFGNLGFILLFSFLFFAVVADKVKYMLKAKTKNNNTDSSRGATQVLANGLIPMMMALLFAMSTNFAFLVGYIASLAEALSDTTASGLGVCAKKTFDPFRWKLCQKGLSGGMSIVGTISALISAFVIPFIAFFLADISIIVVLIASASAFLGSVFDSFLGSVFQAKYKCSVCQEVTESVFHCSKRAKKISGFDFFDNDIVNLFSTAFSGALASVIYILVK